MKKLINLFLTFFKIGLFTFGGGYAMISVIEAECVEKKGWITHDDMMNITVIAESTPGPVAVNCATFVGYKKGGILGALFATLGVVLPSFVIIYLIANLLDNFLEIKIVASAFKGIKLAVGLLITDAAVKMIKKMQKNAFSICLLCLSGITLIVIDIFSINFSTITMMIIAGVLGILAFAVNNIKGKAGREQ